MSEQLDEVKKIDLDSRTLEVETELDEGDLKRKAYWHHRSHALYMLVVAAIISSAFVLLSTYGKGILNDQSFSKYHPSFFPTAILVVSTGWFLCFYIYSWIAWDKAVNLAGNLGKSKKMIEGFTRVFKIYAGTRRAATYASFWAIFGAYAIGFYIYLSRNQSVQIDDMAVPSLIATTVCLMLVCYYLFRYFLPGDTFIEHVISLNERAATSEQSNSENAHETKKLLRPYKKKYSHWFY
jgi:hypothetical protein